MADLRIPATPARAPAAVDPARSAAARSAQAAFFQTALLRQDTPVAALRPAAAAQLATTAPTTASAAPDRILRPGSLVDIRV